MKNARLINNQPALPKTAQMLGTGRPSVSLAAASLENAGLIENLRGSVKILNRKGLEDAACEYDGVIQHLTAAWA